MARSKKVEETVTIADPDNAPTVIAYRVGQLEKKMDAGFIAVHEKLDGLKDGFVGHQEFEDYKKQAIVIHSGMQARIAKLEGWQTWLIRLVLAAVILSIMAFVFGNRVNIGVH